MSPDEFKNYQELNRKKLAELQNSKEKPMFKFFKTDEQEVTNSAVDLDTSVKLPDGKTATMREMINALEQKAKSTYSVNGEEKTADEVAEAYVKMNAKKKIKNSEMKRDPDEIDTEGDQEEEGDDEIGEDKKNKKMKNKKEKKNAEEDCMDNDMEGDEEDEAEGVEAKNKKEKKNSKEKEVEVDDKFFTELKNAHLNPKKVERAPMVVTSIDQIERGKQRYGSGSK